MGDLLYESSSGLIEFLLFQDSLNGLNRYLERMKPSLNGHIMKKTISIKEEKERIKSEPEEDELNERYFTKEEALLGLEFDDNYLGGTGSDISLFSKYFYSSIVILSITILESLIKELVISVEEKTAEKWKPDDKVTLISCVNYLNKHGFTYNIGKEKDEYLKLNKIRKHFIHYLHKENFGRLSNIELKEYQPTYKLARRSLVIVTRIAQRLEQQFL